MSNLYPPHYIGGYELGCRNVVEGLRSRGHDVKVLTSRYPITVPSHENYVYRWLNARIGWDATRSNRFLVRLFKQEITNQLAFKRLYHLLKPQIVYIWNLGFISVSLPFVAQRAGCRVCYFISDNWLSEWEADAWHSEISRPPIHLFNRAIWWAMRSVLCLAGLLPQTVALDLSHVQFASEYLKRTALKKGKPVDNASVIHWGVDTSAFRYKTTVTEPRRLLYVGQLVPHKGVHTVVQALQRLVHDKGLSSVTLTLVGKGVPEEWGDYEDSLRKLVNVLDLERNVTFAGSRNREELPGIYSQHDILVFASTWEEPFSITVLEGMASGLAVVGTTTGGSAEIFEHVGNSLVFHKEKSDDCAKQIERLIKSPELYERIRRNGRETVEQKFKFDVMLDRIESSLLQVAEGSV